MTPRLKHYGISAILLVQVGVQVCAFVGRCSWWWCLVLPAVVLIRAARTPIACVCCYSAEATVELGEYPLCRTCWGRLVAGLNQLHEFEEKYGKCIATEVIESYYREHPEHGGNRGPNAL